MAGNNRWQEIGESFPHERSAFNALRKIIPDAEPYRVWTNFEFMDERGEYYEIDAMVLGRRQLHLLELKSYHGTIAGNANNWRVATRSSERTERSPLLLTRRKAQRLASKLKKAVERVAVANGLNGGKVKRAFPFIREAVLLHADDFRVILDETERHGLFCLDGQEAMSGLPGISERLLEAPDDYDPVRDKGRVPVNEDMSVLIALALRDELGVTAQTERLAGDWKLEPSTLDSGPGWREFPAVNRVSGETARARVVISQPDTPIQARQAEQRRLQREFSLLKSLRQESIVSPHTYAQTDGHPVLLYPPLDGLEPLDLVMAGHPLTADQQVSVLSKVAEALAYAHRNQVANRGLSPATVLLDTAKLAAGEVVVRLADWSFAGRVHNSTPTSTLLGPSIVTGSAEDDVYQAPEDRWAPSTDRPAVDLFALGALAYFVLSGGEAPAADRAGLQDRLRRENGLDLGGASGQFVDEDLRQLVLRATRPSVSERLGQKRAKDGGLGDPTFGTQEFHEGLLAYQKARLGDVPAVDPLHPLPGALIEGRFEVVKVLGAGSTARGVLVSDTDHDEIDRVLKVALDDAAVERLVEEQQVLTQLGALDPPAPGVVELIEGPLELVGRTALLLSNCGEQTLADHLSVGIVSEAKLKAWGTELLDILVALEAAGIAHRDIKPANLGLKQDGGGRRRKRQAMLRLFDFSASRADVSNLEVGTPPYRDPFLGTGTRRTLDSAAERYSAAVVLYEMATATTPLYGDGRSDPSVIGDDVTVLPDDFDDVLAPERKAALSEFFRIALARDARKRFDTAAAMREAWASVFTVAADESAPAPAPAVPQPVTEEAVPEAEEPVHPHSSLAELLEDLTAAAGTKPTALRRRVVSAVLGSSDGAPADPFITHVAYDELLGEQPGQAAKVFDEFGKLWAKSPRLTATYDALETLLIDHVGGNGGATVPVLAARSLITGMKLSGVDLPERAALGLLRIMLASSNGLTTDLLRLTRRRDGGPIAMISEYRIPQTLSAKLASRAERLKDSVQAQNRAIVPVSDAEEVLSAKAAEVLGPEAAIPVRILLQLATAGSPHLGLSSNDELHAVDLPITAALSVVLRGLSRNTGFTRAQLDSRLRARFPELTTKLPNRPKLDGIITEIVPGMAWDDGESRYRFAREAAAGSIIPTYTTRNGPHRDPDARVTDAERAVAASFAEGKFRVLGVPLGASDRVAELLVDRYGAVRIDVTELIITAMQNLAEQHDMPWDQILAADAIPAEREGLKGFVAQTVSTVIDAVEQAGAPVVLTDLSTLAAYGQLGILRHWSDISNPPEHAVWALAPQQRSTDQTGARIDDTPIDLSAPEQWIRITPEDLDIMLGAQRAANQKEHA